MAILNSCCCWKSVRKGSFASGFYTLMYYSFLVIGGTFQVDSTPTSNNATTNMGHSVGHASVVPLSFTVFVLVCAGASVLASVVLLVGLCVDNRLMLIPWISVISVTTCVCFIYSVTLIIAMTFEPILAAIFTLDFLLSLLNVYCLLCVVSQYQEYKDGRGRSEDISVFYQPPVKYDPWVQVHYSSKGGQDKDRCSSMGGLANMSHGNNCSEAKLLLREETSTANVEDQRRTRPRIHFQEPEETSEKLSSCQLGSLVLKDSPSTDTTSSKLPSDAAPSPQLPRTKHVQFCGASDDGLMTSSSTILQTYGDNETSAKSSKNKTKEDEPPPPYMSMGEVGKAV